ncbi:MAG TPA: class I SAM-dependent methyltransferase [Gaiellaceae bacterium]|nr:class I SAM-dependent methyltransferase [Gaiellaceae bacterium]
MKRALLRLLERTGLIGPAFRTYERLVALRPGRAAAVEGPPLPPRGLMVRVAGTADGDWFVRSGRAAYDAIAAHVPIGELDSVLDFGCGCGRVTRYWDGFAGRVAGSDLDGPAVAWCRANLGFARFEQNRLEPPLAFESESFDLVYALSVFTHLTGELQLAWRDELRRVLRPGSFLLVTTHGRSYLPKLDDEERARFERGELVVRWGDLPGTNLCSAYHPEPYLRETFAQGFDLVVLEPEGAKGNPTQDLVLLRRR